MKYLIGKVVGFTEGVITTALGILAVSGYLLIGRELDNRKQPTSTKEATEFGVGIMKETLN